MKCFQATGQGFTLPSHRESFLSLSLQQHTFSQINSSCAVPCWQRRYVLVILSDLSKWSPLALLSLSHYHTLSFSLTHTQVLIISFSQIYIYMSQYSFLVASSKEEDLNGAACASDTVSSFTSPANNVEHVFADSLVIYSHEAAGQVLMPAPLV